MADPLNDLLIQYGLTDPKWLNSLSEMKITHPDHLNANKNSEELYEELLVLASPNEERFLRNLLGIPEPPVSVFEKVRRALEEVGLDAVYWSRVITMQAGVITEQALSYIQDDFYPHLVQFARFPAEKRALRKLLNIDVAEHNFSDRYDKQQNNFEKRKVEIVECLGRLKEFQSDGKEFDSPEVQQVRQRVLECLQVPEEFWFSQSTYKSFITDIESFHEQITSMQDKRKILDDSAVIQNASSGCVLKGVCLQSGARTCVKNQLLQAPSDTKLYPPFHSQHVKYVHCTEKKYENSLDWGMFSKTDENQGSDCYCSTLKCFVVPIASCFLRSAQLKLSDEAIEQIKEIEGLKKDDISDECVNFFSNYGSHACLGPYHFGGEYHWRCSSQNFKQTDLPAAQRLQKKVIEIQGSLSRHSGKQILSVANLAGLQTAKYPKSLIENTSIEVGVIGGPLHSSVALWRNSLMAENTSWQMLDSGKELVPVWEIAEKKHAHEFQDVSCIVKAMKNVWEKRCRHPGTSETEGVNADAREFVEVISKWNELDDRMQYCGDLLIFMAKKREEIFTKELNFIVWPTCYLSEKIIQQFLTVSMDAIAQQHSQSQNIQSLLSQAVRPIDLENMAYFTKRDLLRRLVFEGDKLFSITDYQDFMHLLKLALAFLPERKGSDEVDFKYVSHPDMSLNATRIITEALFYIRKHLVNTELVYDDIFIVTLLLPFNYKQESNVFLSCFTASDMACLREEFEGHSQSFISVRDQDNITKIQAHLILLTLDMYRKWDVTVTNVKAHFKYILEKVSEKISDQNISEILTTLMKNLGAVDWAHTRLQYIMKGVPIEQNNSVLEKLLATDVIESDVDDETEVPLANTEYEELFAMLELSEYFPQKMSLEQALEVRRETLDATQAHGSGQQNQCSNPCLYPFLILQKIMSFDFRCRMMLTRPTSIASEQKEVHKQSDDSDSSISDDEIDDEDTSCLHPLDGLLAVLHCTDNFLRQDLMCKLATCQIAIPLLLPNPLTGEITFTLWAMRTIIKQWKSDGGRVSHEVPIVTYRAPVISFLRFGIHQRSKSHMINVIINDSNQDTFYHYDCDGGSVTQKLVAGLVEIGWYFPSATNNTFKDAVIFVNMHGDARKFPKQIQFLSEISFMGFVFLNEADIDKTGSQILQTMSKAPGGLVLLRTKPSSESKPWSEKYKELRRLIPKERVGYIKLSQKNEAKIKDSIRGEILSGFEKHWKKDSESHPTLEECREIAIKVGIVVDEDKNNCVKGKQMAYDLKSVITAFTLENPTESPKQLLPLQSNELWHEWAAKDKELYRHKRRGMNSIEEYTMQLREDMGLIRKIQLGHAQSLTPLMQDFLTSLLSHEGTIRKYYLQWLKMMLDDLSREILPPLHKEYQSRRNDLVKHQQLKGNNKAAIERCKTDMEKINKKLIYASFGLEHLLREVGQLYEAMALQTDISLRERTVRLPRVAAELLIDGYPLELMDGDAAHVPLTWVSAVLEQVQEILNDPPIITLSILGLQSTGKSTLLNTLFGVRFSVSAGRCTRGAFMQLVPFHKNLREECKCSYFLLVDTEGLRAPELDAMQTQNHDNELATFVIGLANLTVINIYGETPGDLDDILQTSVHAFLRMKAVKLTPGCHFVHQNVPAVMAGEKGMMGRFNFKSKLDTMTEAAAKEECLHGQYSTFNEVIRFNDLKDVTHFPSLWVGDPPMAPVNPGYSLKAIALKSHLIEFASEMKQSHMIIQFSALRDMLKKFWKAVLYENFVFSFKNTLESSTYSFLDTEYGKWSWSFQQDMMKWERTLEIRVSNCTEDPNVRKVFEKARDDLFKSADKKYQALSKEMATLFAERPDREILIKWKTETETQLRHLRGQLIRQAQSHCEQVWKKHLAQAKLREIKGSHRGVIVDQVKTLVSQLEDQLEEKEVEKRFEKQWKKWIKELEKMSVETQAGERDIKSAVQASLREYFKASDSMLTQKQDPVTGKPLERWGNPLALKLESKHVSKLQGALQWVGSKLGVSKKVEWRPLAEAEKNDIFKEVIDYLESIKMMDFHPSFTNTILHKLKSKTEEFSSKDFVFTPEFTVDMALTVCGYALRKFQQMVTQFQERNDPVRHFEQDMKHKYMQMFKDQYYQITQELAAARLCCSDIKRQVKQEVVRRLSLEVVNNLKNTDNPAYIGDKRVVIQKILERIGKELKDGKFDDCSKYIRHPADSIKSWVRIFTEEYCDYGAQSRRISDHAKEILKRLMDVIIEAAEKVTKNYQPVGVTFQITVWIGKFTLQLSSELELDKSEMCEQGGLQQLGDMKYFTDELVKGLNGVHNALSKEFQCLRSSDLKNWDIKPYDLLHDGIEGISGIAGCTAKCPFCHEPCSRSENHFGDHKVDRDRHRPQCLGGWRYEGSEKMVLKTCPQLVRDGASFYISGTTKLHPYKECEKIYPCWKIPEESPGEASNYWKYVVAKFKSQLTSLYSMKENSVDPYWEKLEWSQAIADLK